MGIRAEEIGQPESLGCDEANRCLDILRAFGGRPAVIQRWNAHSDDLGIGERGRYASILHYIQNLDRLAQSSMGCGWLEALQRMGAEGQVRLAGWEFTMHPRARYFAAAAQVGMDIEAGLAPGEGHYVAPAALYDELRAIREAANLVVQAGRSRQPVPHTPEVYNTLRQRLFHVVHIAQAQEAWCNWRRLCARRGAP